MPISELYNGTQYKVIRAEFSRGERMPLHYATSDAFIVVIRGKAKVIFANDEISLEEDSTLLIPANKMHTLQILEDFKASVVLAGEARIEFYSQHAREKSMQV